MQRRVERVRVYCCGKIDTVRRCCPGVKVNWSEELWEQLLQGNSLLCGQTTIPVKVFVYNMDSYGFRLYPTGQNPIMTEHTMHSRELSLTGIHTITGITTAKTT